MSTVDRSTKHTDKKNLIMTPAIQREPLTVALGLALASALSIAPLRATDDGRALDEAALDDATASLRANHRGSTIGAYRVTDYPATYPVDSPKGNSSHGLWLGNSQLHAVNEGADAKNTAAGYASDILGVPLLALTLPNACLQEHLFVLSWALTRSKPDIVVLPLVYDDLREVGLRSDLAELGLHLDAVLMKSIGLEAEVFDLADEESEIERDNQPPTPLYALSLQPIVEDWLDQWAAEHLALWNLRTNIRGQIKISLMHLRNKVFNINSQTKRPMIPHREIRNMEALKCIIEICERESVPLVGYVAPLRWTPEPPYMLPEYRTWKNRVSQIFAQHKHSSFLDYDRIVSAELWGFYSDGEEGAVDFMHFKERGHVILGGKVAAEVNLSLKGR